MLAHVLANGMEDRHYRTFLAIGAVLAVAGLVSAAWAFVPSEGTKTRIITNEPDVEGPDPPWDGYGLYVLMEFSMWFRGEFSGTLNTTSSTPIHEDALAWMIISQSEYDQFNEQGYITEVEVFANIGVNDTVSHVRVPTSGKYYLVLCRDPIIPNETSVTVHFKMSGLNLKFFIPGVALFIGTGLALYAASKWKMKVV